MNARWSWEQLVNESHRCWLIECYLRALKREVGWRLTWDGQTGLVTSKRICDRQAFLNRRECQAFIVAAVTKWYARCDASLNVTRRLHAPLLRHTVLIAVIHTRIILRAYIFIYICIYICYKVQEIETVRASASRTAASSTAWTIEKRDIVCYLFLTFGFGRLASKEDV